MFYFRDDDDWTALNETQDRQVSSYSRKRSFRQYILYLILLFLFQTSLFFHDT